MLLKSKFVRQVVCWRWKIVAFRPRWSNYATSIAESVSSNNQVIEDQENDN